MVSRSWNVFKLRMRSLFRRRSVEHELDQELRFHLDQEIEEGRVRGLSPEEARTAALKKLGGLTQIQEECRDMRRTAFFETVAQDASFAVRTLLKSPGFT